MAIDFEDTCPLCNGVGRIQYECVRQDGEIVMQTIICHSCNGIGWIRKNFEKIAYQDVFHGSLIVRITDDNSR